MRIRSTALLLSLLASILVLPGLAAAQDDSSTICDAEALVAAVEGGSEEGTLAGMADDPVGTAASNNPVLTTLTAAVEAAGLGDTINSAEALTVFAPTDCAFAAVDAATMDAALADPQGLLTTVLGYHVINGEQIASADLGGDYESFTGEALTVDGTTVAGQAEILVPDIMTANATVHLIDTVMLPPSVTEAAQGGDATEEAAGTEAPASDAPASDAPASDAPASDAPASDAPATPAASEAPASEAPASEAPAPSGDASAAPTGGVATGAGGTAGGSTPLLVVGLLAVLAIGGALVARRSS